MPTKAIRFSEKENEAIRFSEKENEAIKDFLEKNPFFDFSTIARMAILNFIENPEISLKATKIEKEDKSTRIQ